MRNSGDPTNFNVGAFSTGAFCAAGALSAALGAGIIGLLNTRMQNFAGLDADQILALLVTSEHRRGHEMQQWQKAVNELAEAQKLIRALNRDLAVTKAAATLKR